MNTRIFIILGFTLSLLSTNVSSQSFKDFKEKIFKKNDTVEQEVIVLESEYPIAEVFAGLDPLMAIYGSAVLEYMKGYQFFLSAYGNKTLAIKAQVLVDDLNSGVALDRDMIDRINVTNKELSTEIQKLETENIVLTDEGKKEFAKGLEHFITGVAQTYILVKSGPQYVDQTFRKKSLGTIFGGRQAALTAKTVTKIVFSLPENFKLIYNNLELIVKYSKNNKIPLPPSVDEVLSDIRL